MQKFSKTPRVTYKLCKQAMQLLLLLIVENAISKHG